MDHQPQTASRDDSANRIFCTDPVKTHRTRGLVERHRPTNMQRSVALENLPRKRPQTKLQHILVGRILIDEVEPCKVDIGLPERGLIVPHSLGIQVHPIGYIDLQLQQVYAGREQCPQRTMPGDADAHQIA